MNIAPNRIDLWRGKFVWISGNGQLSIFKKGKARNGRKTNRRSHLFKLDTHWFLKHNCSDIFYAMFPKGYFTDEHRAYSLGTV